MMLSLPPLAGLRAFEATARHLSMTVAARELNVTPGAVSLQVKELETVLGLRLFERRPRSLALTAEGAAYHAAIRTAFRLMRDATAELTAGRRRPELTLSCTPAFAVQWLVPRLPRFEEAAPGIDVRIGVTNRLVDFAQDRVDVAVRHGLGAYEGLCAERLIDDELVPVCSPDYLRTAPPVRHPADLAADPAEGPVAHRLLHDEHRGDWALWFRAAGVPDTGADRGPVFADGNGVMEAAKAGLGVALVRDRFAADDLAAGRLVVLFDQRLSNGLAYHLVYPGGAEEKPAVAAFLRWIRAEAGSALIPAAPPPGAGGR
ncbi:transcriptional regulator GcvA [Azospirillum sp. TSH64]|uniref:transcriptional regulator GcvA n=1 Tax=Azospirillum sp. TSH64 TaxID=652740 RepID=UPI000D61079A|nr:transcriptional regulator GcvA [Azospirillum sp. TSH64]PWC75768.1 transcriptional regulator [Azospirillum sp. TSH64]